MVYNDIDIFAKLNGIRRKMKNVIFNIDGMSCVVCSGSCKKALLALDGVKNADVNFASGKAVVEYDESKLSEDDLAAAVAKAGYSARFEKKEEREKTFDKDLAVTLARVALGGALLLWSMLPMLGVPYPSAISPEGNPFVYALVQIILCVPVMALSYKIYFRGYRNLFRLDPNMDTLVAVSTTAAFAYSVYGFVLVCQGDAHAAHQLYFESAAVILALISLGKYLENRALKKTGKAIEELTRLAPDYAFVLRDGAFVRIPASEVVKGDTVRVAAGESFCADGVIIKGSSAVQESMITGESLPVDKTVGDKVIGGTVNGNGVIEFEVTGAGEETMLSRIITLVENAQNSRAPIAKLADKVSKVFVPAVMAIAVIAAVAWAIAGKDSAFVIKIFVSVLTIACPCALGLATPTAIITGSGCGAKLGILFKNAEALERTAGIDTVVFDKTGTVTEGVPRVVKVYAADGDSDALISLCASVESASAHPLAKAVTDYAAEKGVSIYTADGVENFSGYGLTATVNGRKILCGKSALLEMNGVDTTPIGKYLDECYDSGSSVIAVAAGGKALGCIALADGVKANAREAVEELKQLGIKTVMLTGDNAKAAAYIARQVGIDEVVSEVLPEGKTEKIKELKKSGARVAMVGDGINDAPALTESDVGIAVGEGSDVAIESADVVLVGGSVVAVADAIETGRATLRNVKENLFWAFIYNVLGIPFACGAFYALGGLLLNPMIAGLAMSCSSVCVVLNALRLSYFKPKRLKKAGKSAIIDKDGKATKVCGTGCPVAKESIMKTEIKVKGMMCAHCEARVNKAVLALEGVKNCTASAANGTVAVGYDENKVTLKEIKDAIAAQDYEVTD